eukprot:SM000021S06534  [mRNA]  locus=s21:1039421:1048753:- [translate_table: standard]
MPRAVNAPSALRPPCWRELSGGSLLERVLQAVQHPRRRAFATISASVLRGMRSEGGMSTPRSPWRYNQMFWQAVRQSTSTGNIWAIEHWEYDEEDVVEMLNGRVAPKDLSPIQLCYAAETMSQHWRRTCRTARGLDRFRQEQEHESLGEWLPNDWTIWKASGIMEDFLEELDLQIKDVEEERLPDEYNEIIKKVTITRRERRAKLKPQDPSWRHVVVISVFSRAFAAGSISPFVVELLGMLRGKCKQSQGKSQKDIGALGRGYFEHVIIEQRVTLYETVGTLKEQFAHGILLLADLVIVCCDSDNLHKSLTEEALTKEEPHIGAAMALAYVLRDTMQCFCVSVPNWSPESSVEECRIAPAFDRICQMDRICKDLFESIFRILDSIGSMTLLGMGLDLPTLEDFVELGMQHSFPSRLGAFLCDESEQPRPETSPVFPVFLHGTSSLYKRPAPDYFFSNRHQTTEIGAIVEEHLLLLQLICSPRVCCSATPLHNQIQRSACDPTAILIATRLNGIPCDNRNQVQPQHGRCSYRSGTYLGTQCRGVLEQRKLLLHCHSLQCWWTPDLFLRASAMVVHFLNPQAPQAEGTTLERNLLTGVALQAEQTKLTEHLLPTFSDRVDALTFQPSSNGVLVTSSQEVPGAAYLDIWKPSEKAVQERNANSMPQLPSAPCAADHMDMRRGTSSPAFMMDEGNAWAASAERQVVGLRFAPTDEELVVHYLRSRLAGKLTEQEKILVPEKDVFETEPWKLTSKSCRVLHDAYFFYALRRKYRDGSEREGEYNRQAGKGKWKGCSTMTMPLSGVTAIKRIFTYYSEDQGPIDSVLEGWSHLEKSSSDALVQQATAPDAVKEVSVSSKKRVRKGSARNSKTKWILHEYHIVDHQSIESQDEIVVCKLKYTAEVDSASITTELEKLDVTLSGSRSSSAECALCSPLAWYGKAFNIGRRHQLAVGEAGASGKGRCTVSSEMDDIDETCNQVGDQVKNTTRDIDQVQEGVDQFHEEPMNLHDQFDQELRDLDNFPGPMEEDPQEGDLMGGWGRGATLDVQDLALRLGPAEAAESPQKQNPRQRLLDKVINDDASAPPTDHHEWPADHDPERGAEHAGKNAVVSCAVEIVDNVESLGQGECGAPVDFPESPPNQERELLICHSERSGDRPSPGLQMRKRYQSLRNDPSFRHSPAVHCPWEELKDPTSLPG